MLLCVSALLCVIQSTAVPGDDGIRVRAGAEPSSSAWWPPDLMSSCCVPLACVKGHVPGCSCSVCMYVGSMGVASVCCRSSSL